MTLTWLGHSCFTLEQDGYLIVTDPYTGVDGYPELRVKAHEISCSHDHRDHHAVECVTLLPPAASPFTHRDVATCHDEKGGALRGTNTVRIFTAGGLSVAHLGDLGHLLTPEQAAAIGPVDAILIPVGGFFTIDAKAAKAVCDALSPRCIVPMHYRFGSHGYDVIGTLEPFLAQFRPEDIHRLEGPSFTLTKETSGVVVPKF